MAWAASAGRILFTDATPDTLTINDSHLLFLADNTYDIGASGATRPRTGYFGTSVIIGSTGTLTTNALTFSGAGNISAGSGLDISLGFSGKSLALI